jgi:hypothetical protein
VPIGNASLVARVAAKLGEAVEASCVAHPWAGGSTGAAGALLGGLVPGGAITGALGGWAGGELGRGLANNGMYGNVTPVMALALTTDDIVLLELGRSFFGKAPVGAVLLRRGYDEIASFQCVSGPLNLGLALAFVSGPGLKVDAPRGANAPQGVVDRLRFRVDHSVGLRTAKAEAPSEADRHPTAEADRPIDRSPQQSSGHLDGLERLAALYREGLLTEEEYAAEKTRLRRD